MYLRLPTLALADREIVNPNYIEVEYQFTTETIKALSDNSIYC